MSDTNAKAWPPQRTKPQDRFHRLSEFMKKLEKDVYPEPVVEMQREIAKSTLAKLEEHVQFSSRRVLDVGCGDGFFMGHLIEKNYEPIGITLGEDVKICQDKGLTVYEMDQSFLEFDAEVFDLIWCRHALEHSIFPYFTLTEFYRVLKPGGWLYIEVPAPDTDSHHERNRNHYSVLTDSSWRQLIKRSGFTLRLEGSVPMGTTHGKDIFLLYMVSKSSS